ncbi:hypothetical protein AVEN_175338-1 [Araneus ventricosus]|uniref:Uncharacterized protein n=1 Tax=Araneus ventricosus TaxID=182803 RepID=A0A4Y2H0N0_ARAVE|nr:hypothetical protein AVEN_175338-1 [Araneus ventricosus]
MTQLLPTAESLTDSLLEAQMNQFIKKERKQKKTKKEEKDIKEAITMTRTMDSNYNPIRGVVNFYEPQPLLRPREGRHLKITRRADPLT